MSVVPSPHQEKEETLGYLERERDIWLQSRALMLESPGDREAKNIFNCSNDRMNFLLEDLFRQTVVLDLDYDNA